MVSNGELASQIRELDAFRAYDRKAQGRVVLRGWRGVHERLVASQRGYDYYQGERRFGLGGYSDLGLWKPVAKDLAGLYNLNKDSRVLQIGCDFGYLLRDVLEVVPGIHVAGTEASTYALEQVDPALRYAIIKLDGPELPYAAKSFDLVICAGAVYTMNLDGALKLLKEIQRVGRFQRYVVLATYEDCHELEAFKEWTLLGQTILRKDQWYQLLELAGYQGDVYFTSAKSLGLTLEPDE